MKNVKYAIPFLALILLIPMGMSNSLAQGPVNDQQVRDNTGNTQGETSPSGTLDDEPVVIEEPYTLQEIAHAFEVLEPHAVFDENLHLTFHPNSTAYDPIVTDRDLEIGRNFALHNDAVMDILIDAEELGAIGKVTEEKLDSTELKRAIHEFTVSKFRLLFEKDNDAPVTGVSMDDHRPPISYTVFEPSIFGTFGITSVDHGVDSDDWSASFSVCQGGFYHPHGAYSNNIGTDLSITEMEDELIDAGYRIVFEGTARWHDESAYYQPYNCSWGAFRDQADIRTNSQYKWQPLEPNPQLLDYLPPSWWWVLYTAWWHDWNNNITPQDPPSNYIDPPM